MKYETPELVALTPAINAIQSQSHSKTMVTFASDGAINKNDTVPGYLDWEE